MTRANKHEFFSIQSRNILAINFRPLWELHYLMELAVLKYLGRSNNIYYGVCNTNLEICHLNSDHHDDLCSSCCNLQERGIDYLKNQVNNFSSFDFPVKNKPGFFSANFSDESLGSLQNVANIKYKKFEIGKAVINAIVPNYGVTCNFSDPLILAYTRAWLDSTAAVYEAALKVIATCSIDFVLVFNGRFPHEAALIAAAKEAGIRFLIHERGSSPKYIGLYIDALPHYTWRNTSKALSVDLNKINEEELNYIRAFSSKPFKTWHDQVFTKNQITNLLPKFDNKLVSIFLSTEEEFVSVPGVPTEPRSIDVLRMLFDKYAIFFDGYTVIIRDHPHAERFSQSAEYDALANLYKFVCYLPPNSEVDSYALIEASEFVITFGSTVGLEALYKGKKVVCLSNQSIYSVDMPGIFNLRVQQDQTEDIEKFVTERLTINDTQKTLFKIIAAYVSNDIFIEGIEHIEGYAFKLDGF